MRALSRSCLGLNLFNKCFKTVFHKGRQFYNNSVKTKARDSGQKYKMLFCTQTGVIEAVHGNCFTGGVRSAASIKLNKIFKFSLGNSSLRIYKKHFP